MSNDDSDVFKRDFEGFKIMEARDKRIANQPKLMKNPYPTPDPQEEDELKAELYSIVYDYIQYKTNTPVALDEIIEVVQAHKQQWELEARIKYERSGMAFVHATVLELTDDTKLLKKLEDNVQVRLSELTKLKETK